MVRKERRVSRVCKVRKARKVFRVRRGVQGFQGFQGSQGFQGAQGFQGLSQAVANWTIGITRVYAVDFVNGNDSNTASQILPHLPPQITRLHVRSPALWHVRLWLESR